MCVVGCLFHAFRCRLFSMPYLFDDSSARLIHQRCDWLVRRSFQGAGVVSSERLRRHLSTVCLCCECYCFDVTRGALLVGVHCLGVH